MGPSSYGLSWRWCLRDNDKPRGTLEPIEGRCGARIKHEEGQPQRYCSAYPSVGRKRCKFHGGASLTGPAHGRYKDGRHSKYIAVIPERLRRHLDAVTVDDVASNRQEIGIVDARTSELLENLDNLNTAQLNDSVREAMVDLSEAIESGNPAEQRAALVRMDELLSSVQIVAGVWKEVRENLTTRDKLARTEIQYQKLLSESVLIENINTFIRALITEAKSLPVEKKVLSEYTLRVLDLAQGVGGGAFELVRTKAIGGGQDES